MLVVTTIVLISFNSCIVLSTKKYNALLTSRDSVSVRLDEARINIENLELFFYVDVPF